MKNLEELIQLRKSNQFHNIGVNVESVIEIVKKSYYNFEKHSVPSAGCQGPSKNVGFGSLKM
ncbi:hypothetical protein [Lactococcus cremoris]